MKINKKMILRDIAGEYILVPAAESVIDTNGLFVLTETAAFIWNNLPSVSDASEMAKMLTEEYDVSYEEAEEDTVNFFAFLRSHGIID